MTNQMLIRLYYNELWNKWNYSMADSLLHADFSFRGSLGADTLGIAAFKNYMHQVKDAFADFHNTIEAIITEDNRSAVRLTFSGTHTGELFGFPPTYQKITYAGAAFFSFEQDVLKRVWVLGDLHHLLQQFALKSTSIKSFKS